MTSGRGEKYGVQAEHNAIGHWMQNISTFVSVILILTKLIISAIFMAESN